MEIIIYRTRNQEDEYLKQWDEWVTNPVGCWPI